MKPLEFKEKPDVISIIEKYWGFDNNQVHTHNWHDKQDCLAELQKLLSAQSTEIEQLKADNERLKQLIDKAFVAGRSKMSWRKFKSESLLAKEESK